MASMASRRPSVPLVLVEISTGRIREFRKNEPPFAALSLAELKTGGGADAAARFDELTGIATKSFDLACSLATQKCVDWLWVDSVQYDRACDNGAGEMETMNALVYWYRLAETCFVHLTDLPAGCSATDKSAFGRCSWFRQLSALPALMASKTLVFYDAEGGRCGDKTSFELAATISDIMRIPRSALFDAESLQKTCAFRKFALVGSRWMTEEPDYLYILASLFDIRQPSPTESDAFHDLQGELVRARAGDLSMLAWESGGLTSELHGVFADTIHPFACLPNDTVGATYPLDSLATCDLSWANTWVVSATCFDRDGGDFVMEVGKTPDGRRMGIRLRWDGRSYSRTRPYRLVKIGDDEKGVTRVVELKTIGGAKRRQKDSPTRDGYRAVGTKTSVSVGSKRTKHDESLRKAQQLLHVPMPRAEEGDDLAEATVPKATTFLAGHPFRAGVDDIVAMATREFNTELVKPIQRNSCTSSM
jgi:hypothetical protein